ncbi:hemerythrin domain-containing protein [Zhengella sp. ZM62]|uniref:hemerythrin domain-containing protein n=1 Tax=Zhengella sedimenti TaxID=3390035 RepID=UPI003976744E
MAGTTIKADSLWDQQGLSRFGGDAIEAFARAHEDKLSLCQTLEEIADSLPDEVDKQKCKLAAREIWPLLRSVHSFEEKIIFPALADRLAHLSGIEQTIARLKSEHAEDECYAEELTDTLLLLGAGDKGVNFDAVGYMLRGFFESVRRHVAFEREIVLRLVNDREMAGDTGRQTH